MSHGLVVWFTGLSGSGKSTIAQAAAEVLAGHGNSVELVDGDEIRRTRGKHLGFSADDVMESNYIAVQICSELRKKCDIVLVPRVSPMRRARRIAREALGKSFVEVYIYASLETVQARDPKGLYERARNGAGDPPIGMPGGLPFEAPEDPDLVLDTEALDQEALVEKLADYVTNLLEQRSREKCMTGQS
jgi:adenylyl-sulfate kinase